ncbi:MAG: Gfo/Idh/MocA family oxidoreductase [Pirellula sp.]
MKNPSRRRFLEESMIATAAALTAQSTLLAQPLASPLGAAAIGPNETIRHAVIGCRIRGKVHAAEFAKQTGVEVAYVCDPDLNLAVTLAESVEKQTGKRPKAISDLRLIVDDKSIDTVSIAAPNHWHALAAVWSMQSGKHVYVEKPVSHNVIEGRRMVQVSDKTKRICQVGTQNRSRGDLAAAVEYIRTGKLGKISHARTIVYGGRGSIGSRGTYDVPSGVDYDLWLGPAQKRELTRPQFHYDWHWDWNTGNGELGNNNIHFVDMCRWLLGLKGLGDSVISIGGRLGYVDAGDTPNTQIVAHQFGDIAVIQEVRGLKTDPFSPKFKAGCIVSGSEGFLAESSVFDKNGELVKKLDGPSVNHFTNFVESVRDGDRTKLNADVSEGHQSTGLCHVGNISYRLGQQANAMEIQQELRTMKMGGEVQQTFDRMLEHLSGNGLDANNLKLSFGPLLKISQQSESFVENEKANLLLGREYRAPFVLPNA